MADIKLEKKLIDAAIRDGFGKGIADLAAQDPHVLALTADLSESLKLEHFIEKYPERFIEVGIAEQNMAGIAAGLALEGFIPFACTFACFQPMRNLDQIRTSICIMNANVKLISSHAGFSFPGDGVQIQALEDIAITRTLPNMTVVVPADAEQAYALTQQIAKVAGPVYMRLGRAATPTLSQSDLIDTDIYNPIQLGKAQILQRGGDAMIIANGYMVHNALLAAQLLKERGFYVGVVNMHTIKPLDKETIVEVAQHTGHIFTVEEHQVNGGLGSAVAEVLATLPTARSQLHIVGVEDSFGDTAKDLNYLWKQHGLDAESIALRILNALS
jgi:transketolase